MAAAAHAIRSHALAFNASSKPDDTTAVTVLVHTGDSFGGPSDLGEPLLGADSVQFLRELAAIVGVERTVTVLGNHEFDRMRSNRNTSDRQGILRENLNSIRGEFPVLAGNIFENDGQTPFHHLPQRWVMSVPFRSLQLDRQENVPPLKVGFFGATTFSARLHKAAKGLVFKDPVSLALEAIEKLNQVGVDTIIGVTHLDKASEDVPLIETARKRFGVSAPALVLGGHNHRQFDEVIAGTRLIKEVHDYLSVTSVDVTFEFDGQHWVQLDNIQVTRHSLAMPKANANRTGEKSDAVAPEEDPDVAAVANAYRSQLESFDQQIAFQWRASGEPLDLRAVDSDKKNAAMRLNRGNGVSMVMESLFAAVQESLPEGKILDGVLINANTFRGSAENQIMPGQNVTMGHLREIVPYTGDDLGLARIPGKVLIESMKGVIADDDKAALAGIKVEAEVEPLVQEKDANGKSRGPKFSVKSIVLKRRSMLADGTVQWVEVKEEDQLLMAVNYYVLNKGKLGERYQFKGLKNPEEPLVNSRVDEVELLYGPGSFGSSFRMLVDQAHQNAGGMMRRAVPAEYWIIKKVAPCGDALENTTKEKSAK